MFGDNQDFFMKSWFKREFGATGLHCYFVQNNHSSSTVKWTLRGIRWNAPEIRVD